MFNDLEESFPQYWTGIFLRFLSICLVYGALVHCSNILSLGDVSWLETPLLWRVMDIILLIFDVIIAISLWFHSFSGIITFFFCIILLQIIPYTLFRQYFITKPEDIETLNGLVGTEIVLMTMLIMLIVAKK
ncbi:hypothetical protein [Crocosphaera sp.]|uniref:hypothetical protein n=1 Tax=Crocosphaera sp. TaxID=2729996 RepID=UPI002623DAD1|nr:hypothetical protein [Crocosphaera sp.]MDJ0579813.1 hypothetical protein [Crocosphaera sp.]